MLPVFVCLFVLQGIVGFFFYGMNIPVHFKVFAIETDIKMARLLLKEYYFFFYNSQFSVKSKPFMNWINTGSDVMCFLSKLDLPEHQFGVNYYGKYKHCGVTL